MKIADEITPQLEEYWAGHEHSVQPFLAPEGLEDHVGTAQTVITKNLDIAEAMAMGSDVIIRVPWYLESEELSQLAAGGVVWLSMWGGLLLPHQLEVQPGPARAESFLAIRRTDGEPVWDEYSFVDGGLDAKPWGSFPDDVADDEPTEYELVRFHVETVERRTLGRDPHACDEWRGDLDPGRVAWWVKVAGIPGGTHWSSHPTEEEARLALELLPDEFYASFGSQPVLVHRAEDMTIERHETPGQYSRCDECGWPRTAHGAQPPSAAEAASDDRDARGPELDG